MAKNGGYVPAVPEEKSAALNSSFARETIGLTQ